MTEPDEPPAELIESQALAAALGGQTWEVDEPPDILTDESVPEEPSPAAPPAPAPTQHSALSTQHSLLPPPAERPPPVERIIEALLFVGGPPLTAERASELIRGLSPGQFAGIVEDLERLWRRQNRPYMVTQSPAGATLGLRPAFRPLRERLTGGPREARLSQPALDVLALVAYRQPLSRAEIDNARGSDSGAVLRQLVRLGLVAIAPRVGDDRKNVQYQTTARFLELFRIAGLDDLPRTGDLQRL